uniref:Uncharacterized protein n=1 Tax=Chromera velia CCMP2878 TaxID=1169474 RepID=A0A0G4IAF8_9ALVE|eukprot:Cvel_12522.t1-p1 / transcript=Cvel_12522.t1 / gene=Cvel_12522 / organism=Chromera_velia_CCMP2878 / gene_product=hypothetical protein / transcript_product=hypothetical protein / location=Cvel_scaffold822:12953-19029(-) / protein_length=643 / sequence_SO=supercontig / SO=protein_coding / is_pseudo=false
MKQVEDDVLSPAKLDLVIKKVVGQRSRMELEEFLDAMVLLASTKYGTVQQNHPQRSRGTGSGSAQPQQQPAPDPCSALVRLYEQHLSTFCATPLVALNADDPPQFIRVVLAALGGLYRLYLSYFSLEVNSHYQSPFAEIESEGLKGFAKFCTDFEIIPFLVSKPHVYACFREAVARPVAEEVSKAVHVPLPGRNFTFLRFVFALLGVAERVFPRDCDTTAFVRLIERMEASKAEHLNATPYPPQILKSSPAMPNFSPPSVAGGAQERQTGGNAAQNKKPEECERAELAEENLPWKSIESSLSKQDRTLMHQVFWSVDREFSLQTRRNVDASGLLGAVTFKFECGPPGPHAPLSMSGGYLSSVRAVPVAPGRSEKADPVEFTLSPCKPRSVAARPHTVQPERLTAPESGREKDAAAPVSERTAEDEELMMLPFSHKCALPLRVLDRPALSQVDADLIFIQMTTVKVHPKDTPTGASNGPGVFPRNPGFIRGKGPVSYSVDKSRPASSAVSCSAPGARQTGGPSSRRSKRHHMNFDAFVKACCEVAARVTDEASPVSALQAFVGRFLVPLSESLLEVRGHDVAAAAMLMADEGAVEILNRCQWGLERIFSHYAHFVSKERPVMHRLRGASARQPKTMMSLQAFNQ